MREPRTILALDPSEQFAGQEGRIGVLGPIPDRSPPVAVRHVHLTDLGRDVVAQRRQPPTPRRERLDHVDDRLESGQRILPVEQPRIVGRVDRARIDRGVGAAEQRRVVSRPADLPRDVRERSSSGVPLATDRWFMAYIPVRIDARLGPQGAVWL